MNQGRLCLASLVLRKLHVYGVKVVSVGGRAAELACKNAMRVVMHAVMNVRVFYAASSGVGKASAASHVNTPNLINVGVVKRYAAATVKDLRNVTTAAMAKCALPADSILTFAATTVGYVVTAIHLGLALHVTISFASIAKTTLPGNALSAFESFVRSRPVSNFGKSVWLASLLSAKSVRVLSIV